MQCKGVIFSVFTLLQASVTYSRSTKNVYLALGPYLCQLIKRRTGLLKFEKNIGKPFS